MPSMNNSLRTLAFLGAALTSALTAQAPCFDNNLGTDLNLGDDQIVQGLALGFTFTFNGTGYTGACLDSNGSIYLGATTTAFSDYSPTEAELLASPQPRICGMWTDFQANAVGSGHIYFNAVAASGSNPAYALFTWNSVNEYNTTHSISVQVKLDANNAVTVTYGPQGATGGTLSTAVMVGASPGLGAASNLVSLATRPVVVTQNTFAYNIPLPGSGPAGVQMVWTPTTPGFVIADNPCTPNSLPPVAKIETLGKGCPGKPTVYQTFVSGGVDVSGMDFTYLPNGLGGYIVIPGIAGPFFTGFATNLGAGDDTTHPVLLPFAFPHANSSVTDIVVSSNGFLTLGNVNPGSGCCAGTAAALLAGESRVAAWWSDLNAATAGAVFADLDTASGDFVVTWNGVAEFSSGGANTFQIALAPNGTIKVRLQSVAALTHTFLSGYAYGHNSPPVPETDLSAITSLDLGSFNTASALVQTAAGVPQLGATVTVTVSGISAPPQGNAVFLIIGFTEIPGGADLALIGAGGCNAYLFPGPSDLQFLNIVLGAPTTTFPIPIPVNPSLMGGQAVTEAVSDDSTVNAFGWKFSNGLRWTVGL